MDIGFTTLPDMLAATATTLTVLLFARAAWHKLAEFPSFTGYVADYRLLPGRLVEPAARFLVAAEIATVVLLVLPPTRIGGAIAAVCLLMAYAGGMAINIRRGRTRVECGCGGPAQPLSLALLARNALLSAIALAAAFPAEPKLTTAETATALACGLTLWLLYSVVEQLLANDGHIRLTR